MFVLDTYDPHHRTGLYLKFDTAERAISAGWKVWNDMFDDEQDDYTFWERYGEMGHFCVYDTDNVNSDDFEFIYDWSLRYSVERAGVTFRFDTLEDAIEWADEEFDCYDKQEEGNIEGIRECLVSLCIINPYERVVLDYLNIELRS